MQFTFSRSGGFAGAIRNVQGTVSFKNDGAEVTSETSYHRALANDEIEQLRAGADPAQLTKAAAQIAARTKGSADLDRYHITVQTEDGKSHNVDLSTSGASNELQGVAPATLAFIRWMSDESKKIQAHRAAGQK